jgi:hypothetical protein
MDVAADRLSGHLRVHPPLPCAQCGAPLYAPEWSEHIDECRVCHVWVCRACDYEFETVVKFPSVPAPAHAAA